MFEKKQVEKKNQQRWILNRFMGNKNVTAYKNYKTKAVLRQVERKVVVIVIMMSIRDFNWIAEFVFRNSVELKTNKTSEKFSRIKKISVKLKIYF